MHIEITPAQAIADKRADNDRFDAEHGNMVNTNRSLDYWHSVGNHMSMREPSCAECAGDAAAQAIASQQTESGTPYSIFVFSGDITTEYETLREAVAATLENWHHLTFSKPTARLYIIHSVTQRATYINPRAAIREV